MTEEAIDTPVARPPFLDIKSIDDLHDIIQIAQGGNPRAKQLLENFINMNSNTERAYFPDKTIMIAVAQQNGYAQTYFKNDEFNPFRMVAEVIETATMGYKGNKSKDFVDIIRQTPNMSELQGASEEVKSGFLQGFVGRGKTE